MTTYSKLTDFASKDALLTGNPAKIVKGVEIDDEFNAIATADATSVKGPIGATVDNTVARWDGTTGRAVQGSGVTISDADVVTASGFTGPHNGTVGATTPSTGAFTTLSASAATNVTTINTTSATGPVGLIRGQRAGVDKGYIGVDGSDNFGLFDNAGAARATVNTTGLAVTGALSATGYLLAGGATSSDGVGSHRFQLGSSGPTAQILVKTSGAHAAMYVTATDAYQSWASGGFLALGHAPADGSAFTERARIDASGNLLVGRSTLVSAERLGVESTSIGMTAVFRNSHATSPSGIQMVYSGTAPNGTASEFLYCQDNAALRASLRSNGGLANFSANDVNLSDERVKKDFSPAKSYYDNWQDIEFVTFLYKDQTDTELNLGVKAQQLESVFPELIDNSGFGEAPEGEAPYKAVYQTDFQYATAKALQEAITKIEALTARIQTLENANA